MDHERNILRDPVGVEYALCVRPRAAEQDVVDSRAHGEARETAAELRAEAVSVGELMGDP